MKINIPWKKREDKMQQPTEPIPEPPKPEKKEMKVKRVDKPILTKKNIVGGHKVMEADDIKEPMLMLMKNDGFTDIIEGVEAGEFVINTPKGEKSINLSPDKMTTLRYGGSYIKTWIAYEDSASPYPEDPLHTAEMYRKTLQKLAMNWREREEAVFGAKGKMWLMILGGVGILLVLLFSSPEIRNFLFGAISGTGLNETVNETIKAAANATVQLIK